MTTLQQAAEYAVSNLVHCDSVAYEEWPAWAKAVAALKGEEDAGVGDTVHRTVGAARSARFEAWHLRTFGKPCGCTERRRRWNAKYPYNQEAKGKP